MKNFSKRLFLICVPLMLVFCILISGCAGRRSVTAEEFTAACEETGYTVTDQTDSFDPSALKTALSVSEDETTVGFFVFSAASAAKSNYAQMLSSVKTGESGEKSVDSSEYNRFYYASDEGVTLLYRNGATLLYASSTNKEKLNQLIDALGI